MCVFVSQADQRNWPLRNCGQNWREIRFVASDPLDMDLERESVGGVTKIL